MGEEMERTEVKKRTGAWERGMKEWNQKMIPERTGASWETCRQRAQ